MLIKVPRCFETLWILLSTPQCALPSVMTWTQAVLHMLSHYALKCSQQLVGAVLPLLVWGGLFSACPTLPS